MPRSKKQQAVAKAAKANQIQTASEQILRESEVTSSTDSKETLGFSYYGDNPDEAELDEAFSKARLVYDQQTKLPYIEPRPGFVQLWGPAFDKDGKPIQEKLSKYESRQWQPRPPATLPYEYRHLAASSGAVIVHGNILYEMPKKLKRMLHDDAKLVAADKAMQQSKDDLQEQADREGVELFYEHKQSVERVRDFA